MVDRLSEHAWSCPDEIYPDKSPNMPRLFSDDVAPKDRVAIRLDVGSEPGSSP